MDDVTPVVAALQKSGFPLQTRVEHEIQARTNAGWGLVASEHPWRDPDGRDQFIDLIASCGRLVIVVECKKAQERALLFLRPLGRETTGLVRTVVLWDLAYSASGTLRDDVGLDPESYRAQFCVSTASGQRLLEQDARSVVLASDAVVEQYPRSLLPDRAFVVPAIVTTAPLYTLRFKPNEVSLDSGVFSNLDPREIMPIHWVRFHKAFTADSRARPRTVLVVNSGALPTFLDEVSRGPDIR